MRIFKGLDNIHAVIDRHESEWRRDNGEPEPRTPDKVAEAVRQRLAVQPDSKSGRFDEQRFLRGSKPSKRKENDTPETVTANEPEAVEIVKNKEGRHSWLYNEVMKAINDASKGTNAKIIAVFVPVVQNSKEFEDLPAAETVTTSPIDESLAKIESPEPTIAPENVMPADFNLIPEIQPEIKAEIAETFREMEEKFDESESEAEILTDESESEIAAEEATPEILPDESESEPEFLTIEPEAEIIAEEVTPAVLPDESESAPEILPNDSDPDTLTEELTPEITIDESESEPEISTVAEILEADSDGGFFTKELSQAITTPEYETEDGSDILQDGEPMDFEELANVSDDSGHEELKLPDELDDDDVFDESITEIRKPDDDSEIVVDGDGLIIPPEDDGEEEIEIIPDPEK